MIRPLDIETIIDAPIEGRIEVYDNPDLTCAEVYNSFWAHFFANGRLKPLALEDDDVEKDFGRLADLVTAVTYDRWSRSADVDIEDSLRERIDGIYGQGMLGDVFPNAQCEYDHNMEDNVFESDLLLSEHLGTCARNAISEMYRTPSYYHVDEQFIWNAGELGAGRKPMFKDAGFPILRDIILMQVSHFFESASERGIRSYALKMSKMHDLSVDNALELDADKLKDAVLSHKGDSNSNAAVIVSCSDYDSATYELVEKAFSLDLGRTCCVVVDSDDDDVVLSIDLVQLMYGLSMFDETQYDTVLMLMKSEGEPYRQRTLELLEVLRVPVIMCAGDEELGRRVGGMRSTDIEYVGFESTQTDWSYAGEWTSEALRRVGKFKLAKTYVDFIDFIDIYNSLFMCIERNRDARCDGVDVDERDAELLHVAFSHAADNIRALSFGKIETGLNEEYADVLSYRDYELIEKAYDANENAPRYDYFEQVQDIRALRDLYACAGIIDVDPYHLRLARQDVDPSDASAHQRSIDRACALGREGGIDLMFDSYKKGVPLEDIRA